MTELKIEHAEVSKSLFTSVSAAAIIMEQKLSDIYECLRLSRGIFSSKMSNKIRSHTRKELWAYLSALMVVMIEKWPTCPLSDREIVIQVLEGALVDAQVIDYRYDYDAYRERVKSGKNRAGVPDGELFGPMFGLCSEFTTKLAIIWSVPSIATVSLYASDRYRDDSNNKMQMFTRAISNLQGEIEDGYKNGLEKLWPKGYEVK